MLRKTLFYISLVILAYILAVCINVVDPDLWARLAVGSIIFQTGGVLKHDIFAYTPTKSLWIDHEWGSSVVFYFFAKYFGTFGLLFVKAALIFGIFLFIVKIILLYQEKVDNAGIIYFTFIAFSLFPGLASPVRCQLFTYFFFTLWLYLLERVRMSFEKPQAKTDRFSFSFSLRPCKLIWLFPATMLFWANLHGGFTAGIGLVAIYAVGEFLNRKNPLKYLGILASSLVVTLINPYGIKYWNYIIEATTMHRPWIDEWKPLTLNEPYNLILGIPVNIFAGFMILAALTVITGIWLAYKKIKPDWVKIILFAVLIYIGIAHKRNTMFLIIAASGILYANYKALFSSLLEFYKDKFNSERLKFTGNIIDCICFALIAVHASLLSPQLTVEPLYYPVGSVQFLDQNNISGNVLTTYRWGNYILWKLYPKCKVSIDGRYEEVYNSDVFDMVMTFSKRVGKNWAYALNKYHTDIIIAQKEFYTREDLNHLKNWAIVYEDNVSYLLLPKNKANKSYIIPDANNKIYRFEDLSKPVDLSKK